MITKKKEYMAEMKVDGFGREVKPWQLLLIFRLSRNHASYFRYVIGKQPRMKEEM